jgi:DNA-directed RNA polymerase specialized sigma24 family protein
MTAERPDGGNAGSVTRWIPGLRRGDRDAVQALWERYFGPLTRIAEARLRGAPRRAGDGEDAAVEALLGFCRDVQKEGRFPNLSGRDNLMRVLVRFTVCRALDFRTREERRRRSVRGDSGLGAAGFEPHPGREPPPELQAQVADLLAKLPDEELREVARLRMEGYTNAEIASVRGRCVATVELKLARIRGYLKTDWADLMGESEEDRT